MTVRLMTILALSVAIGCAESETETPQAEVEAAALGRALAPLSEGCAMEAMSCLGEQDADACSMDLMECEAPGVADSADGVGVCDHLMKGEAHDHGGAECEGLKLLEAAGGASKPGSMGDGEMSGEPGNMQDGSEDEADDAAEEESDSAGGMMGGGMMGGGMKGGMMGDHMANACGAHVEQLVGEAKGMKQGHAADEAMGQMSATMTDCKASMDTCLEDGAGVHACMQQLQGCLTAD